ncbi:MFS transporter, partial [Candidatus Nomurabacteria bacterium]|nr:MFS transporter [Candidatus Nomurabacteria bacterium]
MKKIKNISAQVVVLGAVSFFTDFASEMLYPIAPLFLTSILGASMSVVGIIEGIAEVTAGFMKGYFGALSDRLGRRSIFVLIGYGISGLIKPLPGIIVSIPAVICARVLDRVGKGIRTAPRDALLSSYAKDNSGAVFGFHRAMDTFGAVTGPLVALMLLFVYPGNFKLIYLLAFIPSVFAIGFTFKVKDKRTDIKSKSKKMYLEFWKIAPRDYKILIFALVIFSFVNSSDVFLILKSKQISGSNTSAIFGYILYNFVYALASYPIGLLADKFGKKRLFVFGLFIFSIVYLGFGLNSNLLIIWILFIMYGIYAASTEGVSKAWISDLVPEEFRGSAIGLLTMLSSFAVMFGSFFAGILWDKFGSQVPF